MHIVDVALVGASPFWPASIAQSNVVEANIHGITPKSPKTKLWWLLMP